MSAYFDSSALIQIYVPEATSKIVIDLIRVYTAPLVITHIHELEIMNALRLKKFRGEISNEQLRAALKVFRGDLSAGYLEFATHDSMMFFRTAMLLSARHTSKLGVRSLDLLHVGAALVLKSKEFISCDKRQYKLAKAVGLKCYLVEDSSE